MTISITCTCGATFTGTTEICLSQLIEATMQETARAFIEAHKGCCTGVKNATS